MTACAAGATHQAGSGPARSYGGWCQAQLTAAWRRVLSNHIVPLSRTTSLVPFGLAPDGRSFFADVRSPQLLRSRQDRLRRARHDRDQGVPRPEHVSGGRQLRRALVRLVRVPRVLELRRLQDLRLGLAHRHGSSGSARQPKARPASSGPARGRGRTCETAWRPGRKAQGPERADHGARVRPSCRPGQGDPHWPHRRPVPPAAPSRRLGRVAQARGVRADVRRECADR